MILRVKLRFLLICALGVASHASASAPNHGVVYVEDHATCGSYDCGEAPDGACGDAANPWVGCGEGTGGIAPAIAACFSATGDSRDGCTLVLPKGYVEISSTIDVGDGQLKEGLVFRGHGSGEKSSSDSTSFAGTTLVWAGSTGGTVLKVSSTSWSRFEDFSIDGGGEDPGAGTAGIGISITNATNSSQMNIFRNIYIRDINGTPGIGIKLVPDPITAQTSEMIFEDIFIAYVTTGVYQDGGQTANIHWERVQVQAFDTYGMDFEGGDVYTDSCTLIPDPEWNTSTADIHIANDVGWASFQNNYHETKSGKSYEFETGSRAAPTLFLNNRVLWFPSSGNVIDYDQHGPVTLIGNTFHLDDQTHFGKVYIRNAGGGSPAIVLSKGNLYGTGSGTGCTDPTANCSIVMSIAGNTTLESNDDPLKIGPPLASHVAHEFSHAGLVFESGSLNWKNVGESIKFKQDLNGDLFRMLDGSNNVFSYWTTGGTLHLQNASSALEFEGGSGSGYSRIVGAADPSTVRTITLPDRSGTALVSGITLSGDVAGTLADGATTTTIQSNVVKPSALNASGGASTGQCPAKSSSDQFTWTDVVTPDGSQTLTHKNLGASSNTFPSTSFIAFINGSGTNATRYCGPFASGTCDATESKVSMALPAPAVLSKLKCRIPTATGNSSKVWTMTILKNGSATGMPTCSISGTTDTTCSDTPSVNFTDTETLSIKFASSGSPTATAVHCLIGMSPGANAE